MTTLVHHQHFFPVVTDKGDLKEAFLAVVNTQPPDERVIAKNAERVVTARLRDAKFFWESDRRSAARIPDGATAHPALPQEARELPRQGRAGRAAGGVDRAGGVRRAGRGGARGDGGRLAKADLTSDMVFEFPELQGSDGRHLRARAGAARAGVAGDLHHYLPIGVEADAPPRKADLGGAAVTWAAVSLADKLDTVLGLLGAGEKATGSRDPFGLRRQLHGIVRVLMDLPELTASTASSDSLATLGQGCRVGKDELLAFGIERVRYALEQRGYPVEVVRAATSSSTVSPLRARRIAEALQAMRSAADFQALAVLFKRVKNIARERNGDAPMDRPR